MSTKFLNRRDFMGQANCALISALPIMNTLLNLRLAGSAAAQNGPGDYKALVCLFLSGGNDSFNMLAPRGAAYQEYANIRQSIALPENQLLPINPTVDPGRPLGLHPALPGLQSLFESGKLAFVANVGTLVEHVTKNQYNAGQKLPLGLFSHSDQIEQWQTSIPDNRSGIGWGGRMADLLKSLNTENRFSMNISLDGSNVWQAGNTIAEYAIRETGADSMTGYNSAYIAGQSLTQIRSAALDSQMALEYQNIFQKSFAKSKKDATAAYDAFTAATTVTLPASVTWPSSRLADQLKMVAKTIAGRGNLGQRRNTFFINYGGFDHHSGLIANQAAMLPIVNDAVKAFYDTLVALGAENEVVLYSASDFGRTLTSNSQGSDHAWGGNQFVLGGQVKGKRIYGTYPDLYQDSLLDVGRGRLIPTTSVDEFFAEMALWLGVAKTDLPLVLPNISRFFNTTGSTPPVGFLL
ncbi:MAG: DUF1501 domain-containing protein [Luteolibacter sp.]|uniref:DUF1501 domain-containing protein n=1 Tax=Luteolibacter sp. TaxID=1962973 RepID=UPI003266375B